MRVLIFRYGQIGDTLVALPTLWLLRARYPEAKLVLLSEEASDGHVPPRRVLPREGLIDEYWTFDTARGGRSAGALIALARRIRKGRFDALFYLAPRLRQDAWRARRDLLFFRHFCGMRTIMGHTGAETIPPKVEGQALPRVRSEAESLLDRLAASGFELPDRETLRYDLALTEGERRTARKWMATNGLDGMERNRLVAVGIGGKWPSKRWPGHHFQELGRRLLGELDHVPVIFGGPEDVTAAEDLVRGWGAGAVAAGALGVREAAAAMEGMACYVGNDSGTMHLAAAAGLSCVGIISAQDWPGRWEPFGPGHVSLRHRLPCEGCRLEVCDRELECLTAIEPEQVLDACREVCHGTGVSSAGLNREAAGG